MSMCPRVHVFMCSCVHVFMCPRVHVYMSPKYCSSGVSFGIPCSFPPEFRGVPRNFARGILWNPAEVKSNTKKIPTSTEFQESNSDEVAECLSTKYTSVTHLRVKEVTPLIVLEIRKLFLSGGGPLILLVFYSLVAVQACS